MKEVKIEKIGGALTVGEVDTPQPGDDQILVKSLWTAINPVDGLVINMGIFVESFPIGLGCDASGIVVEVGKTAVSKYNFNKGDYVCGCTRVGLRQYSTARDYFLMDAQVAMRKPTNLTTKEAATIGVSFQAAAFGLWGGLHIPVPKPGTAPPSTDEWVLIIGGAGSVGRAGVQLARASGYKVITSASEKNFAALKKLGATAVFDYHLSIDEQVKAIQDATDKAKINKIFDANAEKDPALAKTLFRSIDGSKYFSTLNAGIGDFEGAKIFGIILGRIGKPQYADLSAAVEGWNPVITGLFENGALVPMNQEVVGNGGLEDAIKAYGHKGDGRKVVVKIQDE